jgi:hypothetical protein
MSWLCSSKFVKTLTLLMNGDGQFSHYFFTELHFVFVPSLVPRPSSVHINYRSRVVSPIHQTSFTFRISTLVQSLLQCVFLFLQLLVKTHDQFCWAAFRDCPFLILSLFCVIENIHQKTNSGPLFLSFNCS